MASQLLVGAAVSSDNPDTEILTALSADQKTTYLIVLNQSPKPQQTTVTVDDTAIPVKLGAWGIAVVPTRASERTKTAESPSVPAR